MKARYFTLGLPLVALFVLSCDWGFEGTLNPVSRAQLRVAHMSPGYPGLRVWLDDHLVGDSVAYQRLSAALEVADGPHTLRVAATGSGQPVTLLYERLNLAPDACRTVALIGVRDSLEVVLLDDACSVDTARAGLRFVHCAPDAPEVAVAKPSTVLRDSVAYREQTRYFQLSLPADSLIEVHVLGTTYPVLRLRTAGMIVGANYSLFLTGLVRDSTLALVRVCDRGCP